MPAYIVATMTIHDAETYRKYTDRTPETLARFGGRFLTRGSEVTTLEGGPEFDERMVLLEFPSKDAALAWHDDPDYQAAAEFRRLSSSSRLLLQDGPVTTPGSTPDPQV